MIKRATIIIGNIGAALLLSACVSFGGKPPPSLLNITAASAVAADDTRAAKAGEAITVAIPTVPQAIATTRVAVSDGATEIAYIKDAVWVEPPAKLFQQLLAETIAAKTTRVVLDPRQVTMAPGTQLSGQLLRFGVDAGSNEAVVKYDALLSRDHGKQVITRRFEARSAVSKIEPIPAGAALNRAANQVAEAVAEWVGN